MFQASSFYQFLSALFLQTNEVNKPLESISIIKLLYVNGGRSVCHETHAILVSLKIWKFKLEPYPDATFSYTIATVYFNYTIVQTCYEFKIQITFNVNANSFEYRNKYLAKRVTFLGNNTFKFIGRARNNPLVMYVYQSSNIPKSPLISKSIKCDSIGILWWDYTVPIMTPYSISFIGSYNNSSVLNSGVVKGINCYSKYFAIFKQFSVEYFTLWTIFEYDICKPLIFSINIFWIN